jgi:hypothetical protein
MNDNEVRRLSTFNRVLTFGDDYAADFTDLSSAKQHFKALRDIVGQLDKAKVVQRGGSAASKEALIDDLRLDLKNIARTARAIAQDEPGFADAYRVPSGSNQGALLAAGTAILQQLKQDGVAAKFIAHELPGTLVADLEADFAAIATAQSAQTKADLTGVESTASVGQLIRAGLKEVKYLNAIMHNKYTRTPDKLRAWLSACHIERTPRRSTAAAAPAPAVVAAQA